MAQRSGCVKFMVKPMTRSTSDISDRLYPEVQYLDSMFKSYGSKISFSGRIVTIECFEDNSLVEEALKTSGNGSVLVIDAGGSMKCAILGDKRIADAIQNEWQGIIVNGAIRDSAIINKMSIGIRALGTFPRKSIKKGVGKNNVIVSFSNVKFIPNQYLYADEDGVIITKTKVDL